MIRDCGRGSSSNEAPRAYDRRDVNRMAPVVPRNGYAQGGSPQFEPRSGWLTPRGRDDRSRP